MKKFLLLLCLTQHILYGTELKKQLKARYEQSTTGLELLTPVQLLITTKSSSHIIHRPTSNLVSLTNTLAYSVFKESLDEAKKVGTSFYDMIHHSFHQPHSQQLFNGITNIGSRKKFFEPSTWPQSSIEGTGFRIKGKANEINTTTGNSKITERVVNALRAHKCINKENLSTLTVPNKFLLWNKETGHWHLFAQEAQLPKKEPYKLSLAQLKDLISFVQHTGFTDFTGVGGNIMLHPDDQSKLMFIDTENRSFKKNGEKITKSYFINPENLTEEAASHLRDYGDSIYNYKSYLPAERTLDPSGLNLEKAKSEFKVYLHTI